MKWLFKETDQNLTIQFLQKNHCKSEVAEPFIGRSHKLLSLDVPEEISQGYLRRYVSSRKCIYSIFSSVLLSSVFVNSSPSPDLFRSGALIGRSRCTGTIHEGEESPISSYGAIIPTETMNFYQCREKWSTIEFLLLSGPKDSSQLVAMD